MRSAQVLDAVSFFPQAKASETTRGEISIGVLFRNFQGSLRLQAVGRTNGWCLVQKPVTVVEPMATDDSEVIFQFSGLDLIG